MVKSDIHELLNQHKFSEAFESAMKIYEDSKSPLDRRQVIKPALINGNVDFGIRVLEEVIELDKAKGQLTDTDLALSASILAINQEFEKAKIYFEIAISKEPKYTENIIVPIALAFLFSSRYGWKEIARDAKRKLTKQSNKQIKLAKFLLNEIDENEFLKPESSNETLLSRERCKKYYYIATKSAVEGNISRSVEFWNKCIESEGKFLEIEYFIALQEVRKN